MSNMKKFELYVECTSVNGYQVFACEAENEQAAKQMFRDGQCVIIDEQLEVVGLHHHPSVIEESDDISSRLRSDTEQELEAECHHHKKKRHEQSMQINQLQNDKVKLVELLQALLDAEGVIETAHNRKIVKSVLEDCS